MLKRTAIIELSPDRIAVIVPSATAPSSSCVLLDPDLVAQAWENGLTAIDEPLYKLITDSGVRGGTARLVYASPDSFARILSLAANTKHAERVAHEALIESCPYPVPEVFAPAVPLVVDRPSEHRQCHWLLSGDRGEHLTAAAAWLQRAGVRAEALIPLQSAALARAVAEAIHLDATKPGGPAIALRIGRHCTAIAGVHNGRVLLAQSLSVSATTFIEALTGAIDPSSQRHHPGLTFQPTLISRATAATLAYEGGFTGKATRIAGLVGLTAQDLQPILQPALQKLAIEIDQAMNAAIPESLQEHGHSRMLISGAGVAMNGFTRALGETLGMPVLAHTSHERFKNDDPISPGSLLESLRLRDLPRINLLTGEPAQRIARRKLRMTSAAGVLVAAALGGLHIARNTPPFADDPSRSAMAATEPDSLLPPQLASLRDDLLHRMPAGARLIGLRSGNTLTATDAAFLTLLFDGHDPNAAFSREGVASGIADWVASSPFVETAKVDRIDDHDDRWMLIDLVLSVRVGADAPR